MSKREDFLNGLVRGADFGFAGGATCAGLADGFPGNGATAAHDEKAAHVEVLKHFNFHAVVYSQTDMAAPVGVTESLEGLAVPGRSSVSVGFAIMRGRVV